MAKKNAAPFKAARKSPAGKKASPKKVTAPKTHKPKGSPKERLAYLNKGEMAALVKRKGTPARKGPRGLPSFADDSASSKGVSRGDSSGTKGSGSTKTSNGSVSNSSGGGGYNSGTSGSRGGGASSQSPGAGGSSGRGQGGQNSGAGRDSSRGLGSGAGTTAIGKSGPRSPMSGQGSSFSSPQAAAYNNSRVASGRGTGMRGPLGPNGEPSKQGQGFKTSAPKGTVGTPRGYVNREALNRVDTAMKPLQAVGEQLPYFAPGVGPLVGRVAQGAVPLARGLIGAVKPSTVVSAAEAERIAEAYRAVEAYQAAAAARGQVAGSMAVSMRSLPVKMEQRQAWTRGPSTLEKTYNKVEGAIDTVTDRLGYGVGEVARARAVSGLSAGHGLGRTAYEAADSFDRRSRADAAAERAERDKGKTDRGGYRAGGLVKSRKTFKNK